MKTFKRKLIILLLPNKNKKSQFIRKCQQTLNFYISFSRAHLVIFCPTKKSQFTRKFQQTFNFPIFFSRAHLVILLSNKKKSQFVRKIQQTFNFPIFFSHAQLVILLPNKKITIYQKIIFGNSLLLPDIQPLHFQDS